MDWDDLPLKSKRTAAIGDNLETLSVAELEDRIKALEAEIERVRAEVKKKRDHEAAAAAIFKT